jgi:chromosome partitioning protein
MRIVAVSNQKGGCGKTTTSVNLSACLSFLGKRVLLIDLDPQGHAGLALGINQEQLNGSLYDVLSPASPEPRTVRDVIIHHDPNLHIVPSQVLLSALEQELSGLEGRENRLAEALQPVRREYDFVILDCAPGLGIMTFNALCAASEIIIPVETSIFSLHGIAKFMETIMLAERTFEKLFDVHVLLTIYDGRTKLSREFHDEVREYFDELLLKKPIRRNIRLGDAASAGQPITTFDRRSSGFQDYMLVATEMLERGSSDHTQNRPSWLVPEELNEKRFSEAGQQAFREDEITVDDEPEREFGYIPTIGIHPGPETIRIEGLSARVASSEIGLRVRDPELAPVIHEALPVKTAGSDERTASEVDNTREIHFRGDTNADPVPDPDPVIPVLLGPLQAENCTQFAIQQGDARVVMIAGDFNNWRPQPLEIREWGVWQTSLELSPGNYHYKFVIDNRWINDPNNPDTSPNDYGSYDSVVQIT